MASGQIKAVPSAGELAQTNLNLGGDAYDNTATYAVGALCIYNNVLYRCTTEVSTAEEFDSTKWTVTNLLTELTTRVNDVATSITTRFGTFSASTEQTDTPLEVVALLNDAPTGSFVMARATSSLLTSLCASTSVAGVVIAYKGSSNNLYYFAFNKEKCAIGNIATSGGTVTKVTIK